MTRIYRVEDRDSLPIEIEASSPREAAETFIRSEGFVEPTETEHFTVLMDGVQVGVTIHPEEPECSADEHAWVGVGGIKENPGVWSSGAGIVTHARCVHCGVDRHTNTDALIQTDGSRGLSIRYEQPAR